MTYRSKKFNTLGIEELRAIYGISRVVLQTAETANCSTRNYSLIQTCFYL